MKVYKVTLVVIDLDDVGGDEIQSVLENTRYPNRCIAPKVLGVEERDIGEWSDDHPLNLPSTMQAELERLFGSR